MNKNSDCKFLEYRTEKNSQNFKQLKPIIMKFLLTLYLLFSTFMILFCQNQSDEYRTYMKDGIEYKTNGKQTIMIVDPMPEFPNGTQGLANYLSKNLKYPESARINKIEGKVYVNFVIAANGKVRDIKIVKSVCPELDAEAIRVVEKMPKWKPGEQHGKPIPIVFSLPINFKL